MHYVHSAANLILIAALFFAASRPAFATSLLCQILEQTDAKVFAVEAAKKLTTEFTNESGEMLTLSAKSLNVTLEIKGGGRVETIELSERISQAEFQALVQRVKRATNSFGIRMSYMKEALLRELTAVRLNDAFYRQPTPVRAARELVKLLERTKQEGGGRLKVELITDGVPTTFEQIQAMSRWASTLNEVIEQRLLTPVAEEVARRKRSLEEEQRVAEGRKILEQLMTGGEAEKAPANPQIDLAALLDKTVADPKAVKIRVSGFVNGRDNGPLEIQIEKYRGGISVRINGFPAQPKSLAEIADYVRSFANGHWRTYEDLSSRPFPG
jgi:hypothetical protein